MLDQETLRRLIREVISEEVATVKASLKAGHIPEARSMTVSIGHDRDLADFAHDILRLAEDAQIRDAILGKTYPFHLAAGKAIAPLSRVATSLGTTTSHRHRVDKGVVTEAILAKLPAGTTQLTLAAGVSITPLARDKARALNIKIERIGQ